MNKFKKKIIIISSYRTQNSVCKVAEAIYLTKPIKMKLIEIYCDQAHCIYVGKMGINLLHVNIETNLNVACSVVVSALLVRHRPNFHFLQDFRGLTSAR